MNTISKMRTFFESFKSLSFWKRLFSWNSVLSCAYGAWEEYVQLSESFHREKAEKAILLSEKQVWQSEKTSLADLIDAEKAISNKVEARNSKLENSLMQTDQLLREKEKALQTLEQLEAQRVKQHDHRMAQALAMQESFENEKKRLNDERIREVQFREEKQRETWRDHESAVATCIKRLCDKHAIEYVTEFTFRGKPDNAIKICDEIIVFDAKSPAGENLDNFFGYLKNQTELSVKYASHESVRKDVYMVVPSNTSEVIGKWSFDMGTHRVYIITLDALEPVILSLKQLETYDFAEQLSPEDRQAICRVIGSLLYASKRRIQVDQFFNGHLLELIAKVQRELPDSMLDDISKNEKAMKLNPSVDKRSKEISLAALNKTNGQLDGQANSFDVPGLQALELVEQYGISNG
ncbi:MAG TPA: hypothetical protein VD884_17490 [Ohtaekwangia sp.]|nr:hypothetical protein [Ohtaekwangia sp.]